MNGLFRLLVGLTIVSIANPTSADEIWMLLHEGNGHVVAYANDGQFEIVTKVGYAASYADSSNSIVIVSQQPDVSFQVDVIDKKSRRSTASWPVKGHAMSVLSGPSRDAAILNGAAYFMVIRYVDVRTTYETSENELNGHFDLTWVSLTDGSQRRAPLPPGSVNSRLSAVDGGLWIYNFGGSDAWKVDLRDGRLAHVVSRNDVDETMASLDADPTLTPGKPGLFADFVILPKGQVLRLSKFGKLQRVLGGGMSQADASSKSVDVAGDDEIRGVYGLMFKGEPSVGVLRKHGQSVELMHMDPKTLHIRGRVPIRDGIVAETLTGAGENMYYVDQTSGDVVRIAKGAGAGDAVLNLKKSAPSARLYDPRIISVQPAE